MNGETNIMNIQKEDREFIRMLTIFAPKLTDRQKILTEGIVIGLQLQDEKSSGKVAG